MGTGFGTGAKGIRYADGSQLVAILDPFYLDAGIEPEQINAIIIHQRQELSDNTTDSHLNATIAEYTYILETSGTEGLLDYHKALSTILEGDNSIRSTALQTVLTDIWSK